MSDKEDFCIIYTHISSQIFLTNIFWAARVRREKSVLSQKRTRGSKKSVTHCSHPSTPSVPGGPGSGSKALLILTTHSSLQSLKGSSVIHQETFVALVLMHGVDKHVLKASFCKGIFIRTIDLHQTSDLNSEG